MVKYVVIIIDAYKILSNILLSRLTPYAEEIIGDSQCVFQLNRSTIDCVFCIHQILEKKWEYNEAVHQPFTELKPIQLRERSSLKSEYGMPLKLVR
jgi:hypothetical protein